MAPPSPWIDLFFQTALRHMAGLGMAKVNRGRRYGDGVLLSNVDGSVYRVVDAYDGELSLGNIAAQSIEELLQSEAYAMSLVRDSKEFGLHCESCSYRAACNGRFLYDTRATFPHEGSCVTAWHCIHFMVRFIEEQGYAKADIHNLLMSIRKDEPSAQPTANL